jgi:hypothetical protein
MLASMSADSDKVIMGRNIAMHLGSIIDFKNGKLLRDELELNLECDGNQPEELCGVSTPPVQCQQLNQEWQP